MNTAVFRGYAHAWFAFAWFIAILATLPLLKCAQVYCELRTDRPDQPVAEHVSTALHHGLLRRLDDPSLWALFTGAFAAFLLGRAIVHASQTLAFPEFLWTRSFRAWLRFVGWSLLLTGIYLTTVYLKKETFWYGDDPQHANYVSTFIPRLQALEGALNLAAIILAASLVPPTHAVASMIRGAPAGSGNIHCQRAAARLATLGVSPLIAFLFAMTLFGVLWKMFKVGPIDKGSDLWSGVAVALMLCSPTLVTTWRFWMTPRRWGISLGTLTVIGIAALLGIWVWRRDVVTPPPQLFDVEKLPSPLWVPAATLDALGYFGAVLVLWFYG